MSQVNVIDSVVITEERDTGNILAEWSIFDPSITVLSDLTSAQAVKLFLNWSDRNGTITLRQGDYFTFAVSDVFDRDNIKNVTDSAIMTALGEVAATYSIYDNNGEKEVKITFTDYVESHSDISGDFWMLLFIGKVDSVEEKNIEFILNGELAASGEVTINPEPDYNRPPLNEKNGYSALGDIYDGYYIFNWTVRLNMEEDAVNGFRTLEDFSFEDVIPENSPHVFLTDEIRQDLGLLPNQFPLRIGEYTGADSYPPENRYPLFRFQYNSSGANLWSNFNVYAPLVNGYTTVGINGTGGLNVSNVAVTEKSLSADLGTLTRPTTIQYCTAATVKIAESALGDPEVVRLFENTFKVNYGEDLTSSLIVHRFESGGSAQGITGDYSFTFTKISEDDAALPGAVFSLYISEDFSAGADRIVYSSGDGAVTFKNLPAGTFYLQETITPGGYVPDSTVYKVELSSTGFEIYYGDNYENKLSDHDNKVVNKSAAPSCSVILTGTKKLTGRIMPAGMFSFVVTNGAGAAGAAGTNAADGGITFSEIRFDSPGEYTFTVEETAGTYSGVTYDSSKYTVTVTVAYDGSGGLTAEAIYPDDGITFSNSYAALPVSVSLRATKILTGKTLAGGMFSFVVTNSSGEAVSAGTNDASGSITFSEIKFDSPGEYTFTVEETAGTYSGVTYDSSKYTVTVTVTDNGSGNLAASATYPGGGVVFNNRFAEKTEKPCICYARSTECRKTIEGKIIWADNDNAGKTRPFFVKIALLRDGEIYKSIDVDSAGDGTFVFCCVPAGKNPRHEYSYQIDEPDVPAGYTKTLEGYNVINTLTP